MEHKHTVECCCDDVALENAALREKVNELNRRCQRAESAALTKVDEVRRSGPSLGRALAGWAAERYRKALEEIRQLVHPKGNEPRLEGCAGCMAEKVLGSSETKSERA
jgi:uncharacterized protein with PhoU and TrkA domain